MTNELAAIAREIEQAEDADRETLTQMLSVYADARDKRDAAGRDVTQLGKYLRDWLNLHPGEELWDAERNIVAFLRTQKLPVQRYDVNAIIQNNPQLWARLIEHGCIELNVAAIKAAGPNIAGIERYAFPKEVTESLQVVRK